MTERCPYDPKHIMPYQSLLRHLDTCKSQNKVNFIRCKFNQLHAIHRSDAVNHERTCPDNKTKGTKNKVQTQWDLPISSSKIQSFDDQPVITQNRRRDVKKQIGKKQEKQQKYGKSWLDEDSWNSEEEPFDADMSMIKDSKFSKKKERLRNQSQQLSINKISVVKQKNNKFEKQDSCTNSQELSIKSKTQVKEGFSKKSFTIQQF